MRRGGGKRRTEVGEGGTWERGGGGGDGKRLKWLNHPQLDIARWPLLREMEIDDEEKEGQEETYSPGFPC